MHFQCNLLLMEKLPKMCYQFMQSPGAVYRWWPIIWNNHHRSLPHISIGLTCWHILLHMVIVHATVYGLGYAIVLVIEYRTRISFPYMRAFGSHANGCGANARICAHNGRKRRAKITLANVHMTHSRLMRGHNVCECGHDDSSWILTPAHGTGFMVVRCIQIYWG